MSAVLWAAVAWLLGGVPAARVASRFIRGDAAEIAGALAEAAIGYLAVAGAPEGSGLLGQVLAATAVLAGYQWPLWGVRGRRGLAVSAGAFLAVSPFVLPAWGVLWGLAYVVSGYPALGRAVASLLAPFVAGFFAGWPLGLAALPCCALLLERERDGLRRVLLGTEHKHVWRPES